MLETFGPRRLIFASNWPIMTLMGTYRGWLEALDTAFDLLGVSSAERDAIYCDNAVRTYGLPDLDKERDPEGLAECLGSDQLR